MESYIEIQNVEFGMRIQEFYTDQGIRNVKYIMHEFGMRNLVCEMRKARSVICSMYLEIWNTECEVWYVGLTCMMQNVD